MTMRRVWDEILTVVGVLLVFVFMLGGAVIVVAAAMAAPDVVAPVRSTARAVLAGVAITGTGFWLAVQIGRMAR